MGGPIFIIGAMGSGTTLLRLMLDSHEHIAIPHETGFMRAYKSMQFIPFKWTGGNWAKRLGWTKEELDEELRTFFDRIFMRYATQHGKQRWGEKTPLHTWHVDAMARVFPDAVFVGLVRHPGASTTSNMKRFSHGVAHMVLHYNRYTKEVARQAMRHPDRFVVLRYEDLVLNPEPVMRELLEWLGEPWSDRVLQHHEVQADRGGRIEGKSRPDEPVDSSRIDKWARTVADADRRAMTERLGRLGEFFGYSMDEPARLEPLNDQETFLIRAEDLRRRAAEFSDLGIRKREPVPIFEQAYNPKNFWLVRNPTGKPPQPKVSPLRRAAAPVTRRMPEGVRTAARRLLAR